MAGKRKLTARQVRYLFATGKFRKGYSRNGKSKVIYAKKANGPTAGRVKLKVGRRALEGDRTTRIYARDEVTGHRMLKRATVQVGGARAAYSRGELSKRGLQSLEREISVGTTRQERTASRPRQLADRNNALMRGGFLSARATRAAETRKANAPMREARKAKAAPANTIKALKAQAAAQKAEARLGRAKSFKARDNANEALKRSRIRLEKLKQYLPAA